ncbi:MAG: phage tail sheath family protein [Nitriliruptorales bacterium]|nr:phage tail sheath family protein [Nitriliruptorales bacterium]
MPTYLSPGVYVEEMEAGSRPIEGVGTAVAAFVGIAAQGPVNEPTLITNWSQFTQTFGEFVEGSYLAHSVYGYFMNGGGACYVVRVGANGHTPQAQAELTAGTGDKKVAAYRVEALEEGPAGNDLTVEVADPDASDGGADDAFKLLVKRGNKVEEQFDKVTTKKGKQNVVTVVNQQSKLIRLKEAAPASQLAVPEKGGVSLAGGGAPTPKSLSPDDYVGDTADRTGFGGLEAIDAVTMVCVPDLMAAYQQGMLDLEGVQAVQLAQIAHCELMGDRVAVLDPPPGLNAQQIREWRVDKAGYDSKYAALYWPWIKVFDPASGQTMAMPPSAHVAGIWGRNDDTRGVHKAPANEVVRGAISLELQITKNEHDLLNPHGINCLRSFPGRGIRVWGARTLSSDPAWRYLNIRRLFNYLEESILGGTQWAVFEPNDHALWAKMRRTISAFLVNEWRKGALFGLTPDEAFYVKCDDETNPAESIDAGMVICEIGVAPVKPAEFVIFRLSQYSGGAALTE